MIELTEYENKELFNFIGWKILENRKFMSDPFTIMVNEVAHTVPSGYQNIVFIAKESFNFHNDNGEPVSTGFPVLMQYAFPVDETTTDDQLNDKRKEAALIILKTVERRMDGLRKLLA